jgi:hypothetical protein
MSLVITIDSTRYLLPTSMNTKDVQALSGILVSLVRVDYEYLYGSGDSAYYAKEGAVVSLSEVDLYTREEAKAAGDKARAEYEARKAAEALGQSA